MAAPTADTTLRIAKADDAAAIAALLNLAYRPNTGDGGWTHESAILDGPHITTRPASGKLGRPE